MREQLRDREAKRPRAMALAAGRYSLERLLAKEDKNRKGPLWKTPRLSEMGGSGIAVRLKWQSGSGCGDAPPDASKGNRLCGDGRFVSVENKPDLNRKIYRVHCHCFWSIEPPAGGF